MEIREIEEKDLAGLLELYMQLHNNSMPVMTKDLAQLWHQILSDPNHHIIIGVKDGNIISSCVLIIIPNLTHQQQPYALIENVITDEKYRGKGYATKLLNYAKEMAVQNNCYKIMLMTGSKKDSTLNFYEKAGYNRTDKTAFIHWL
ncbi:MAG TPA: GNAT family N-acetyltransferase [Mobilitalea sp.]|nr:GNAT family N-acetyltransferase [Mobilitalea sp.]